MMLMTLALLTTAQAQQKTTLSVAPRQADGFGLGVVVGEPTSISMAFRNAEQSAVQLGFGWNIYNDSVHLTGDYLHNLVLIETADASVVFPVYLGVGGLVWSGPHRWYWDHPGDSGLAMRIPLGIAMLPRRAPVDVFLEVVPGVDLLPYTDGFVDAGLGARFYF